MSNLDAGARGQYIKKSPTYIYSSDYGLKGDNLTDNQTGLETLSSVASATYAANPKSMVTIVLTPGMYRFSGDWVIPPGISLDMTNATLLPTKANRDTPAVTVCGKDALIPFVAANSPTQNAIFKGLCIINVASINQIFLPSEANKRLCAAIRFKSFNDIEISTRYIGGFRIGMLIWPESGSACGYVKRAELGSFITCSVGIELRGNVNSGWANALGFIGGHFQPTSTFNDFGNATGLLLSCPPSGYAGQNEITMVNPTFEVGGTHNVWTAGVFKQTGKCVLSTTTRADGLVHLYEIQTGGTPTAGNEPTHINGGYATTGDGLIWRDLGPLYRSHLVMQGCGSGVKITGARGEGYRLASILSMYYGGWCPNLWAASMSVSVGMRVIVGATRRMYSVESISGNSTLGFTGTAGTTAPSIITATVGSNELPIGDTFTDEANVVWRYQGNMGNVGPAEVEITQRNATMVSGIDRDVMDFTYGVGVPIRPARVRYLGVEEPNEIVIKDVHKKAVGSAAGWCVPGAAWVLGGSSALTLAAVSNSNTHAVLKRDSIYFTSGGSNYPGWLMDAQHVKRFMVHNTTGQQANKALGRYAVRAYDKSLTCLTYVGGQRAKIALNTIDGNASNADPAVGVNAYGAGSPGPTNTPSVCGVSPDSAYAHVGLYIGDVSSLTIKPMVDGADSVMPQSAPLHCPFTSVDGPRYSAGTPTIGWFHKGEYIHNYNAGLGQPKGWFCTTAGALAPAWATGTAVLANELRVNAGNVYAAQAAGTTGVTAPTGTSSISDGVVTWDYIGPVAVIAEDGPALVDYTSTPASVPAGNTVPSGTRIKVGINEWISDGSRWRPVGGQAILARLLAPVVTTGTTEEIALQATLYPWMVAIGDEVKLDVHQASEVAGTVANRTLGARIGALGTIADSAFVGTSFNTTLREARCLGGCKIINSTTARVTHANTSTTVGTTTAANGTNLVLGNIASVNNIVSITALTNNAAEPVTTRSATITLLAG